MSYITSGTLQGVTPEFYRSTPFEFETTAAASCLSVVVTTALAEPAGSRQITANPPGGGQGEWEPTPLNV